MFDLTVLLFSLQTWCLLYCGQSVTFVTVTLVTSFSCHRKNMQNFCTKCRPPTRKKNFQDTKIMENQDIFQDKFLTKTCIKQDKHGPKNSKIDKKAYLYVTNIGINLTGNLVGSSPSQVRSPSLQNGGSGVSPPRKFWKSIFNLVHSDAFFSLSGQFRSFLPFFRTT